MNWIVIERPDGSRMMYAEAKIVAMSHSPGKRKIAGDQVTVIMADDSLGKPGFYNFIAAGCSWVCVCESIGAALAIMGGGMPSERKPEIDNRVNL